MGKRIPGRRREAEGVLEELCATTKALDSCLHRRAIQTLLFAVGMLREAQEARAIRHAYLELSRHLQPRSPVTRKPNRRPSSNPRIC